MKPTPRLSCWAGIVFLARIGICAPAESTPPPPAPLVEEVGPTLSGAKKDFEVVKSLREHGSDPKNDQGRLVLPRMPSAPVSAAGPSPRPDPSKDAKPGANWLVDAMQKREAGKNPRSDERRDLDTKSDDRPGAEGEQTLPLRDQERKGRVPPPNPFAPYMQGWISPADLPLLRPALEFSRGLPGPGTENGTSEKQIRVAGIHDEFERGSRNPLMTAQPTGGGSTGQVRENPYLVNLEKGALVGSGPAVSVRSSVGPVVTRSAPSMSAGDPPAASLPAQSRTPDFVRQNSDDKYFKPLKRF